MVLRFIVQDTTDEDGVASVTYTPTGRGRVRIQAFSGDLESNVYELIDAKFKDIGTSTDYSNWNNTTSVSISRSDTETTLQPVDPTAFASRTVNTGTATTVEFDYNLNIDAVAFSLRQGTTSVTALTQQYLETVGQTNVWHHIVIETDGTKYRAIINGNVKSWKDMTGEQTFNRFQFSFNQDTGLVVKYKNFVMY